VLAAIVNPEKLFSLPWEFLILPALNKTLPPVRGLGNKFLESYFANPTAILLKLWPSFDHTIIIHVHGKVDLPKYDLETVLLELILA
jgi:ribosome-binding ATPase YchF (GTP1/OBG family)